MPDNIAFSAPETSYKDAATLMLHSAVAMNDYYGSGTDLQNMAKAMHDYFNYKQSAIQYRHNFTKAEWTQLLINELDNGRSLLIQGMTLESLGNWHTNDNIAGHWFHCDGYNEEGEFHIVIGFGNYRYDGYYDLNDYPYSYNVGILVGLEPDLNGKTLSLTQPNGNEIFVDDDPVSIVWKSSGVNTLRVEYTLDDGQNWIEAESLVDANLGKYTWTHPQITSAQCRIRLTDSSNINVYDKSDGTFTIEKKGIELKTPTGGENYVLGSTAQITWSSAGVQNIGIYYTIDNGDTWNEIDADVDASLQAYQWLVPQNISNSVLIKIEDSSDENNYSISNEFKIVASNNLGGPYINDENTVLLLHGESDLLNQSAFSDNAALAEGTVNFAKNEMSGFGKAFFLDNSSVANYLTVPHTDNLSLNNDWTIELWFKPTGYNSGLQYLIWKPGDDDEYFSNYSMQLNGYWNNALFSFYFSGDSRIGVTNNFIPSTNEWYHVAFLRSKTDNYIKMIVRNSEREILSEASFPNVANSTLTNLKDLKIGFNFSGYIDEVRISDIVRNYSHPGGATAVHDPDAVKEILIYPNPTSGKINIEGLSGVANSMIQLFNMDGRLIHTFQTSSTKSQLDITGYSPGVYNLILIQNDEKSNFKIIKP